MQIISTLSDWRRIVSHRASLVCFKQHDDNVFLLWTRAKYKEESKELDALEKQHTKKAEEVEKIQKELDQSQADFQEFERKDIKYREDLKFMKTKLRKIEDKRSKVRLFLFTTSSGVDCTSERSSLKDCLVGIPSW